MDTDIVDDTDIHMDIDKEADKNGFKYRRR